MSWERCGVFGGVWGGFQKMKLMRPSLLRGLVWNTWLTVGEKVMIPHETDGALRSIPYWQTFLRRGSCQGLMGLGYER